MVLSGHRSPVTDMYVNDLLIIMHHLSHILIFDHKLMNIKKKKKKIMQYHAHKPQIVCYVSSYL